MAISELKKRKRSVIQNGTSRDQLETSKPTATFTPRGGRTNTLSLALPGSIIANALTHDSKTALAGQIGRALAIFCVDEVIIFNDGVQDTQHKQQDSAHSRADAESGYTAFADPNHYLFHILSYLETPPYLRRTLFPRHPNLRTAGTLPSLDMPHHLRANEWCQYREGVTIAHQPDEQHNGSIPTYSQKKRSKEWPDQEPKPADSFVEAGLQIPVKIPNNIPPNVRVTLKFPYAEAPDNYDELEAEAVAPEAPREEAGYYWGYTARMAGSISAVFTESPYDQGYTFSIGTSERGQSLQSFRKQNIHTMGQGHVLLVFGGVAGLEAAVRNNQELVDKGVTDPSDLFDAWVNLIDGQGSRTIRTEEAVLIGLMGLVGVKELQ